MIEALGARYVSTKETSILEGADVFVANEGLIKQLPTPLSVHVYRLVWRQMILFAHNIIIFVIIAPYLGVLVYLLVEHQGMAERNMQAAQAQQSQFDQYVQSVAGSGGGAAAEIEKAKSLLDSGAITQAEFEAIKSKALARA